MPKSARMLTQIAVLKLGAAIGTLRADVAKAWGSDKHPRWPKGSPDGGKFKGEGDTGSHGKFVNGVWTESGQHKPWWAMPGKPITATTLGLPDWGKLHGPLPPAAPPKGAIEHPAGVDDKGNKVWIHRPKNPTHQGEWQGPDKVVTVTPGAPVPKSLNGVPFTPWAGASDWTKVEGQNPGVEAGLPDLGGHDYKHAAAGVIIEEPDGRVWLTSPTNGFGGYRNTFPKGTQEHGLTLQQTAIKEAFEETGLKIAITGVFGDFERTTSMARYYLAKRVGGTPAKQGWESQALRLAPHGALKSLLNMQVDRDIARAIMHERPVHKAAFLGDDQTAALAADLNARMDAILANVAKAGDGWRKQKRWPAGTPLGGKWMAYDSNGFLIPPQFGNSAAAAAWAAKADAMYWLAAKGDYAGLEAMTDPLAKAAEAKGWKPAGGNEGGKFKAAQYGNELLAQQGKVQQAEAKVEAMSGPDDLASYKKTGAKPGGSNPGGIYTDSSGTAWLIKGANHPSDDRAKNEVLASKLMLAAGVAAPDMKLVKLGDQYGGGLGVASKMVDMTGWSKSNPAQLAAAQNEFAVHAWLANYDAVGQPVGDNLAMLDGEVYNYDPGGALLYRAQGMMKSFPGGKLPLVASEWDGMRDPKVNPYAAAVYGSMDAAQLAASAAKVAQVSDDQIKSLVDAYGPGGKAFKASLADALIARKAGIIEKAKALAKPAEPAPALTPAILAAALTGKHGIQSENAAISAEDAYHYADTGYPHEFHQSVKSFQMFANGTTSLDTVHAAVADLNAYGAKKGIAPAEQTPEPAAAPPGDDVHKGPVVHLINQTAGHNKAWAISVSGSKTIRSWGGIGFAPQTKVEYFPTHDAALSSAYGLITEKLNKGYGYAPGSASAITLGTVVDAPEQAPAPAPEPAPDKAQVQFRFGNAKLGDLPPQPIHNWMGVPNSWAAKDTLSAAAMNAKHAVVAGDLDKLQSAYDTAKATKGGFKLGSKGSLKASGTMAYIAGLATASGLEVQSGGKFALPAGSALPDTNIPKPDAVSVTGSTPKPKAAGAVAPKPAYPEGLASNWALKAANAMSDAYDAGDMNALEAAGQGNSTPFKWSVNADGAPASIEGGKVAAYWHGLKESLDENHWNKVGAAIEADVKAPTPGEHVGDLPAMPRFDKAKLPGTNSNAASHNAKVDLIAKAAAAGDVKGILGLGFATNTYGKQQVKLANNALEAMGSPFSVTPGQKKGQHPVLLGTQTAPKATNARLSDDMLPPKIDFANYKGPGQGLSSVAAVNAANQQAYDHLIDLAKAGDFEGVKNAKFQPISKETGKPVGEPILIAGNHPSTHVKTLQDLLVQTMNEKLNPPKPLEVFEAKQHAASIALLAEKIPPLKLGAVASKYPTSQQIGHYIAIGQATGADKLVPKKTIAFSPAAVQQAKADYQTWQHDSDAESFRSAVQGHGGHEYHSGWDNDMANSTAGHYGKAPSKLIARAMAAHKWARTQPAGTKVYKWENLSPAAMVKLATAQPGLIIQNPAPSCTSYDPTATKGFGSSHRWNIIYSDGAKGLNSFGSGSHAGEKEVTMLPNHRFMILEHHKAGNGPGGTGKSFAETTVLLLPPDPKLDSNGWAK